MIDFKPYQWFFVFNSCEQDYSHSDYIQEYFSAISSFAFFLPYIIRILILKKIELPVSLVKVYYVLILVGVTSTLFHTKMTYLTQFIDMTSILIAQLIFANTVRLTITPAFEKFMIVCYFLSVFHPLPISINLLILFILFSRWVIQTICRLNMTKFTLFACLGFALKICALLCIPLDIVCAGFEYFHGFWHIFIATYCFSGLLAIEILMKAGHLKPE